LFDIVRAYDVSSDDAEATEPRLRRIRWVAEWQDHVIGETTMTVVVIILATAGAATVALGVWLAVGLAPNNLR